jgi:uncharacterized PurR-regulated membrane protein YhhQ (DUF165 family)
VERRAIGWAALAGFVACVWGANWFVDHVGTEVAPGLHTLPVGFGEEAPSGFVLVGISLTLRDLVQRLLGVRWTVGGILVGAALAASINTDLAVASGVTFLLAELLDLSVYTPLQRRGLTVAVVASNVVGALADSVLFLWLAFDLAAVREFALWQAIGKVEWGLLFLPLVWLFRRRWPQPAGVQPAT